MSIDKMINNNWKNLLKKIVIMCDDVGKAIHQRNSGRPYCHTYCPGENALLNLLNQLVVEIKNFEPECSTRLIKEMQNLKMSNCVNPYAFGAIVAIVNILSAKYIDTHKKRNFSLVIPLKIKLSLMPLLRKY